MHAVAGGHRLVVEAVRACRFRSAARLAAGDPGVTRLEVAPRPATAPAAATAPPAARTVLVAGDRRRTRFAIAAPTVGGLVAGRPLGDRPWALVAPLAAFTRPAGRSPAVATLVAPRCIGPVPVAAAPAATPSPAPPAAALIALLVACVASATATGIAALGVSRPAFAGGG